MNIANMLSGVGAIFGIVSMSIMLYDMHTGRVSSVLVVFFISASLLFISIGGIVAQISASQIMAAGGC